MFHFVYADEDGNGYIDEDYFGLGLLGANFVEPSEEEVIPLPEGASLTMIPNRAPVVINDEDQFVLYPGEGWRAAAAGLYPHVTACFYESGRGGQSAAVWIFGSVCPGRRAVCGRSAHG